MSTTPIFCPHCRSLNIEFVTEYHQAIGLRILKKLIIFGMFVVGFVFAINLLPSLFPDTDKSNTNQTENVFVLEENIPSSEFPQPTAYISQEADNPTPSKESLYLFILVVLLIGNFILDIIIYVTESKTHVQAICRDCGEIWLLN